MLATEENSPGDAARVLALEEEGLGLSVLEAEDLAVATDEQLTLYIQHMSTNCILSILPGMSVCGVVVFSSFRLIEGDRGDGRGCLQGFVARQNGVRC